MKAGTYWIGDLCYVLGDRWESVCELIIVEHKVLDGVFTLPDGTEFAIYSTAYGDGTYEDREGRVYLVDSGSIGCVLVSSIDDPESILQGPSGGNVIEMDRDFSTYEEDGLIVFGDIEIQTSEEEEYWGEEGDEDY